ncbi:MAG: 1,2-phenylacetyl-CoA epoxidase subunit PaaD [Leifsonia sp.]
MPRAAVEQRVWEIAATVVDPELPVLTIEDLGILRRVSVDDDGIRVEITPTYSGCPAIEAIRADVLGALAADGFAEASVEFVLSPAWTTDWMSAAGRDKLRDYGITPPRGTAAAEPSGPVRLSLAVKCPRCDSLDTREIARFGSTSCKALYECRACLEPFDYFKVL